MKHSILAILIISLAANIFAGIFFITKLHSIEQQLTTVTGTTDDTPAQFPYLAKRIFADNKNDIFVNFVPLRQAIVDYTDKLDSSIALYFEYLPSGSSIGINEKQEVSIASLVKVPTVMAVYEKIHEGKMKLTDTLELQEKDKNKDFGSFWNTPTGTKLTVEETIKKTLIESDNTTHNMLLDLLTNQDRKNVYDVLDIRWVKGTDDVFTPFASAKSISSILKSLFFASYLPIDLSNEILTYMTQSEYKEEIVAGVDPSIPVAHKIGEYEKEKGKYLYSDCGIVYVPKRQYILCIMYQGTKEDAVKHMQYLSKMVYTYITQVNPNGVTITSQPEK